MQQPGFPMGNPADSFSLGGPAGGAPTASNNFMVEVVSLTIQETGTYNDAVVRPYNVHMNQDSIHDILNVAFQSNLRIGAANMASLAPSILQPMGREEGLIHIPNGWGERRLRFMLQIRETAQGFGANEGTYFTMLQGFTNHFGVNPATGSIDQNMVFFVNSFVRIQEYVANTPNGPQTMHRVERTGQMINGNLVHDASGSAPTTFLRPADVHGELQNKATAELMSGDVMDFRNTVYGGGGNILNNFDNNSAAGYLSRLIAPSAQAVLNQSYGRGNQSVIDRATQGALGGEPSVTDSPFLMLLHRRYNSPTGGQFTMADLSGIDGTVAQRTTYRPVDNRGLLPQRGVEATWVGGSAETIVATKLMNTLPGLMWNSFIGIVALRLTNLFGTGITEVIPDQIVPATSKAVPHLRQKFVNELADIVGRDISNNHAMTFDIGIYGSILGDITLDVSLNGRNSVRFIAPAFGSGVLNPIYSHNRGTLDRLATQLGGITEGLEAVVREQSNPIGGYSSSL